MKIDEALRVWAVHSGTLHANIKAMDPADALTKFLIVAAQNPVVLHEVIALRGDEEPIESTVFYLTAKEAARRHLAHNKYVYQYINDSQIEIDDDWISILRKNAAHWKGKAPDEGYGIGWFSENSNGDEEDNEDDEPKIYGQ